MLESAVDIDARTKRALEWGRLKEFLALQAQTAWGKQLCMDLEPASQETTARILLDQTTEAASLLEAGQHFCFENVPDLRPTLTRLSTGAYLSIQELLDTKSVLVHARQARLSLGNLDTSAFPHLASFKSGLHVLEPLVNKIDLTLDESGQVKDSASPQLNALRREVHGLESKIGEELTRIIHSPTLSKSLQEPIITQRSGRYVLPVHANMRQTIQGIVHDSSASGLTVYVEPMVIVELANQIRLKETKIEREIVRVLSEVTQLARASAEQIKSSYDTLIELDFIFARARLGQQYRGTCPHLSQEGKLHLGRARHPLLLLQSPAKAAEVVPNDILLDAQGCTIVVTGPNTGGKTVLLKTTGLLSLMVSSGLLLPVSSGSSAIVFKNIYADIGDEQSLVQSLSTFSSHITNIVEIINYAGPGTLVLLDEIGAGTDPKEGAVLARAVLEHLNSSGAYTVTTTHFGELKVLAYAEPGFVNASLDFDEATLSPTYKLRIGIPGSSKATTIARRLGLKPAVVERAESLLTDSAQNIQLAIEHLEEKLKALSLAEDTARQATSTALALQQLAQQKISQVEQQKDGLRQQYASELAAELATARQTVRSLIAQLQKEPGMQKAQLAQKQMEHLQDKLGWLVPAKSHNLPGQNFYVGQKVKITSLNTIGTVELLPEDVKQRPDARIAVKSGNMHIEVPRGDLEIVSPTPPKSSGASLKSSTSKAFVKTSKRTGKLSSAVQNSRVADRISPVFIRNNSNTLDLRGLRVEAALANCEHFLDSAVVAETSPMMIIHGHGTGAIKSAVRQFLGQTSYRLTFRPGEANEGGDGVTIIDLA